MQHAAILRQVLAAPPRSISDNQPFECHPRTEVRSRENFQKRPYQELYLGFVHDAHAAFTQFFENLIM